MGEVNSPSHAQLVNSRLNDGVLISRAWSAEFIRNGFGACGSEQSNDRASPQRDAGRLDKSFRYPRKKVGHRANGQIREGKPSVSHPRLA